MLFLATTKNEIWISLSLSDNAAIVQICNGSPSVTTTDSSSSKRASVSKVKESESKYSVVIIQSYSHYQQYSLLCFH